MARLVSTAYLNFICSSSVPELQCCPVCEIQQSLILFRANKDALARANFGFELVFAAANVVVSLLSPETGRSCRVAR
jgi:hypothetical protein